MKKVVTTSVGEILDLTRDGIAAVLEFSARLAGGNTELSAQFGRLYNLMREASFWAREAGRNEVRREGVDAALSARAGHRQRRQPGEAAPKACDQRKKVVIAVDGHRLGEEDVGAAGVSSMFRAEASAQDPPKGDWRAIPRSFHGAGMRDIVKASKLSVFTPGHWFALKYKDILVQLHPTLRAVE